MSNQKILLFYINLYNNYIKNSIILGKIIVVETGLKDVPDINNIELDRI